ncbi:UvrD-like helicase, ATP-binding domain, P-loop containing nucleoside triphosphate hydrolase [Tanacetum coccineum]
MNKKKSANKNTTNYRLYHALMEALIADEDAMDKEVADKVKDHKRKHDSDDDEDDDDDEGPSAGSNQGRSTKRRRSDSAASGSAKPPPKADDQSSKKPRESEASASKQHPSLSSTGWQITDTREAGVDSSMHRSDPESEHSEQSTDDISKQDEGNDSDMEDTDKRHKSTSHSITHPSETIVFHNEDGNPARANIKQALGYRKDGDGDGNSQPHKGVKASANSDVKYSFTSAQDGEPLQDDVRLCLGNDLKKAQDHTCNNTNQKLSVGVVSPYASQVVTIQEKIAHQYEKLDGFSVEVKSIDGVSGWRQDIINLSTIRSNSRGSVGFQSSLQRTNVALTRARLWILGNERTLTSNDIVGVKKELDQLDDLANGNSSLFKDAKWKFMNSGSEPTVETLQWLAAKEQKHRGLVQVRKLDDSVDRAMRVASSPQDWREHAGDTKWEKLAKASGLKAYAQQMLGTNSLLANLGMLETCLNLLGNMISLLHVIVIQEIIKELKDNKPKIPKY